MARNVDKDSGKLNKTQEREAAKLEDKLEDQGLGQDDAKKRARAQVAAESESRGGSNAGGEPQKGADLPHRQPEKEEETSKSKGRPD